MKIIFKIILLILFLPLVTFASSSNWDSMIWDNDVWYDEVATLINLSSFTATPKAGKVIIQWSTEAEIDNVGFNIYRVKSEVGEYKKINSDLIVAEGSPTQGASYEFIDSGLRNNKPYYYKLEDIDTNGISTFHGPVKAVPRWLYGLRK